METPEQLLARIRAARSVYSTSATGWTAAEAYRTIKETCSQLANMTTTYLTLTIPAAPYADHDDCLAAVAADYVADHPEAEGYDLSARWADDDRDAVEIDVPVFDAARNGDAK